MNGGQLLAAVISIHATQSISALDCELLLASRLCGLLFRFSRTTTSARYLTAGHLVQCLRDLFLRGYRDGDTRLGHLQLLEVVAHIASHAHGHSY